MEELIIAQQDLNGFIAELMNNFIVVGPVRKENRFSFDTLESTADMVVDYDTSVLPPSKWIFTDNEPLLDYDMRDMTKTKDVINSRKQILAFVHPCDINGINIMDEILGEDPVDFNYLKRRRDTIIIGYECLKPCKDNTLCFDKGFQNAEKGWDLFFTNIGKGFYVQAATEEGKEVISKSNFFQWASYREKESLHKVREEGEKRFKKAVQGNINMLSHLLKESYDDMIWDVEGKKCLSCGACNIVCPTCYCFDVTDELNMDMKTGRRYRKWDSCQLTDFCKVASGENFRESVAARVRHRLFKKEVYLKKRFGRSGCVGCGRCIYACIANISIIDIYNQIMAK